MRGTKEYSFYDEHARTCDPEDFHAQVKRTVGGKPVGEDQIQMIVEAILSGLGLAADDVLLDLCCGNGAITDRIFMRCRGGLGVDISEYMIEIARKHFGAVGRAYRVADVEDFVSTAEDAARFTKALCYGSFYYFSPDKGAELLKSLRRRFPNLKRFFVGNLPDKALMGRFFDAKTYVPGIENDHGAPTGIWRTEAEFTALARACGWSAEYRRMPAGYFTAHYRYDAILSPASISD